VLRTPGSIRLHPEVFGCSFVVKRVRGAEHCVVAQLQCAANLTYWALQNHTSQMSPCAGHGRRPYAYLLRVLEGNIYFSHYCALVNQSFGALVGVARGGDSPQKRVPVFESSRVLKDIAAVRQQPLSDIRVISGKAYRQLNVLV
jgi:hypothetical protein